MNPTRTESVKSFLRLKTHSDLFDLYSYNMECQVNVAQDGGKRVESEWLGHKWQGWTDDVSIWKTFRIPYNADTNPSYEDKPMSFDLAAHVEGIGLTGWDWVNRKSRWVAYDFDHITGHSEKHEKKLSQDELDNIRSIVSSIDWVTLRKSTSGSGLHIYVFLEPVETKNHTEHAALARAILGKLAALTGFDFFQKVDACGSNMWIWHRKMTKENQGLTLLKAGTVLKDIPKAWQNHIPVISGHRKTVLPKFLSDSNSLPEQKFDELASKTPRIDLDDEHKKLIRFLEEHGTGSWWDIDHHMLVTHTFWLSKAHSELDLRGEFSTLAKGEEAPSDINCFAFPMRKGAWAVRRYTRGVAESELWEQDAKGYTRCFYNSELDFTQAARLKGGLENKHGAYVFKEAEIALDAMELLGIAKPEIAGPLRTRPSTLKIHKDGRVLFEIDGDNQGFDADKMKGFLHEKGKWIKFFNIDSTESLNELEGTDYDDLVRHLVTTSGDDSGWAIKSEVGKWRQEPLNHIQMAMKAMGIKRAEVDSSLGASVMRAWTIVHRPFQPEYPGGRLWNKAATFRIIPTQGDNLNYPHWIRILEHVGESLTPYLANNVWAQVNNIITGADYLKIWIASMFKEPMEPLPYLFIHGEQNSGKSILHEALSLLMDEGYALASSAIRDERGFNFELAGAVLAVIEEIDLRKDKHAANRIKDWVTARMILMHPKGVTPYPIKNSLHFIQCGNNSNFCPVFPGDSRITMIHVPNLELGKSIPKKELLIALEREAPDFLAAILKVEIPPSNDRLNVPVLMTAEKMALELSNSSPVEIFLQEFYYRSPGDSILLSEIYSKFENSIGVLEAQNWTKHKFIDHLPNHYPKGRRKGDSQVIIGNISDVMPDPLVAAKPKLVQIIENKYTFLVPENSIYARVAATSGKLVGSTNGDSNGNGHPK